MLRIVSLLIASLIMAASIGESQAQSISPDGEAYTPAEDLPDYGWYANTLPVVDQDAVILRDGEESWDVSGPNYCRLACDAFLGCTAFLYFEPRLKNQRPSCQMLKSVSDPAASIGVHLYVRK